LQEKIAADRIILKNKFLEDLIQGKLCGNDILSEATDFHFNLLALHYRVILSRISQNQYNLKSSAEIKKLIKSTVKGWDEHFSFFISKNEFVSILKGNSLEQLTAKAKETAENIASDCRNLEKCSIISAIGKNVTHLSEISDSYFSARKLMKKVCGIKKPLILSYDDLKSVPLTLTDTEILSDKLKYMSHSEIPEIIAEYTQMLEKNQNLFSVIASYLYVDIVKSVLKYLEFLGEKPESLLPEILKTDFIENCIKSEDIFLENASIILTKVLDFRDSKMQGRYSDLILRAKEFIAQNYANQNTCLTDVAEEIHLSPNHFSTIFSQECGMTFIEYLTNVRVENAKKLLQDSDKKGYDIAYECGFSDPHYFSFIFKKTTGLTPREYRELQKNH
ncbi:MAG: helix-turn-helix transcriptional regulator, partial [Treponema sp.]|nr:helix-turn-helix transcriptional regulator [Treponema sp.]